MPDGSDHPISTANTYNHPRLSNPVHEEKPLRIAVIGAGASGLLFAYKLQRSFENFELTIYEKNADVSGTWYENKYPGCACDIPSHIYSWSFEPSLKWSSVYAGSDEIHAYFKTFSEKYNLQKYYKLSHEVLGARWNDHRGRWDVEVKNSANGTKFPATCDILINAAGVLNKWRWPTIPGLETYKGKLLHTARWDTNVDLNGKHVGLIGNGSSAIQVLPAISPVARKVTSFVRSATWVSPAQGLEQHIYSEEERREFETNPDALLRHRKAMETSLNALFGLFISDHNLQQVTHDSMVGMMKAKLNNEALEQLLIPKWGVGCRRLTPGVNYLETIASEKVEVVHGDILQLTERGCLCEDGKEYPVDVLICATGFDTSFRPRFPLIGENGKNLADLWEDEPKSYLGLAVAGFPNYFMFIGPNSPIGNGPVLISIEAQAEYMLKMIDRWQTENIHSFSPKRQAVDDFIAHKDNFMKGTVWQQECRSWYKNNSVSGKVSALWPGSTMHYLEAIAEPRYDDWDFKYEGNRFAWLGNGFSQTEMDRTADWAYYVRNADDGPFLSRGKRRRHATKSGTVTREAGKQAGVVL